MYCSNCGTFSQPGARFCFHCGAPMPTEQPAPQIPLQPVPAPISEVPTAPIAGPESPAVPAKKGSHFIPALILAAMSLLGLILFFALPLGTGGADPASAQFPWFTLDDGVLFFDENLYSGSPELTVPEEINGRPVVSLGKYCFAYCSEITTVTLPDTLTGIGEFAFSGCGTLRVLEIPEGVTSIGAHAFEDCTGLEAIHIPAGVTQIGSAAFRRCSSLKYIFFDGSFAQWTELYDAKINPNTTVYCTDGEFPLG